MLLPSPHRSYTQEVLQPTNLICNHLSLQWNEYNFRFYISCFLITPAEREETDRDSLEHVTETITFSILPDLVLVYDTNELILSRCFHFNHK